MMGPHDIGDHSKSASSSFHEGLHGGVSEVLLFDGVYTQSTGPFFVACVIFLGIAFLLEVIRHYTSKYERHIEGIREEKQNLLDSANPTYVGFDLKSWLILGLLYSVTYLVSVSLMLVAMTYNIYLILALTAGYTAGKIFTMFLSIRYS